MVSAPASGQHGPVQPQAPVLEPAARILQGETIHAGSDRNTSFHHLTLDFQIAYADENKTWTIIFLSEVEGYGPSSHMALRQTHGGWIGQ